MIVIYPEWLTGHAPIQIMREVHLLQSHPHKMFACSTFKGALSVELTSVASDLTAGLEVLSALLTVQRRRAGHHQCSKHQGSVARYLGFLVTQLCSFSLTTGQLDLDWL